MDRERGMLLIIGRIYMPSPVILPIFALWLRPWLDICNHMDSVEFHCIA